MKYLQQKQMTKEVEEKRKVYRAFKSLKNCKRRNKEDFTLKSN